MAQFSMERVFRRGFGGVFHARGRDDRMQFWIFVALVFGPLWALMVIAQMVMMFGTMFSGIAEAARSDHPATMPGQFSAEMMQTMIWTSYLTLAINALACLILTTAAARRLHDRNRSGWWAVTLPVAMVAFGIEQVRRVESTFGKMDEALDRAMAAGGGPGDVIAMQAELQAAMPTPYWSTIVASVAMIWLVVELVRAGTPGDNRFGSPPE